MASLREMKQFCWEMCVVRLRSWYGNFLGLLREYPQHISEVLVKSNNNESRYSIFFKAVLFNGIYYFHTHLVSSLFLHQGH